MATKTSNWTPAKVGFAVAAIMAAGGILVSMYDDGKNKPPSLSSSIPFFGNMISFASNPLDLVKKGYDKHGSCFTVSLMGIKMTFFLGPKAQAVFFRARDHEAGQAEVYKFMTPVFGEGVLYDAPEHIRAQQLKIMSKALLRTEHLKGYVEVIQRETVEYFDKWGDQGEVDLSEAMAELTILTASRALLGKEIRENLFKEVSTLYHDLDKGIQPISVLFPYLPTEAHRTRDRARIQIQALFSKVIKARRAKMEASDGKDVTADTLQLYIESKYDDGRYVPDEHIVGMLIGLLFAGQHTSSITTSWTTMLLLKHPETLKKVMKQTDEVVQESESKKVESVEYPELQKMTELQHCVNETLRMYPPLIMLMRMALKDIEFEDTDTGKPITIPKGHIMVSSPAVSGRISTTWSDPDSFDTSRWSKEESFQSFANVNFGAGLHACMGKHYGAIQLKSILSIMFSTFDLEMVEKELPEPNYESMVVGPKGKCLMRYKRKVARSS